MIFDTNQFLTLAKKFQNKRLYEQPSALILGTSNEFLKERLKLEFLFNLLTSTKQRSLISRILNPDENQHLAAWFELRLFGWLRQVGETEFEPEFMGENPDCIVKLDSRPIVFEARAVSESKEQCEKSKSLGQVFYLLTQIQRKYIVVIKGMTVKRISDEIDFKNRVTDWLDRGAPNRLDYGDDSQGHLVLEAQPGASLSHVGVIGPTSGHGVTATPFLKPLKGKANQHKKIRASKTPYVIAIFIDNFLLSAEEVVTAWFGNLQYTLDLSTDEPKILDQAFDKKGLHFLKDQILHKTVSATIVFKRSLGQDGFDLKTWWIENPFAYTKVDSRSFPVDARWLVQERNQQNVRMGWEKQAN